MVNPSELRIGNLVQSNGQEHIVAALAADKVLVNLGTYSSGEAGEQEDLQYIPLSEEWMSRFSQTNDGSLTISTLERTTDSSDMVILSTIECYLHDEGFLRVCAYEYEKLPDDSLEISDDVITLGYKHIRYVHQLQNLYFDLCGKELELKETNRL